MIHLKGKHLVSLISLSFKVTQLLFNCAYQGKGCCHEFPLTNNEPKKNKYLQDHESNKSKLFVFLFSHSSNTRHVKLNYTQQANVYNLNWNMHQYHYHNMQYATKAHDTSCTLVMVLSQWVRLFYKLQVFFLRMNTSYKLITSQNQFNALEIALQPTGCRLMNNDNHRRQLGLEEAADKDLGINSNGPRNKWRASRQGLIGEATN